MKKQIILGVVAASLFFSCNVKENEELKARVVTLEEELKVTQKAADQLQEVSVMLDSIEANRTLLSQGVIEGTNYTDYAGRMKNLQGYIKDTQVKLTELEGSLKKSKSNASAYAKMVEKLKADLAASTTQVALLQAEVEKFRVENTAMAQSIVQKDSLLDNRAEVIKVKESNIVALETKVKDITNQSTLTQADLLYAQGAALETAASRTKLAPRKKKETQREALELYKLSYSLGKQEAKAKIDELEKVVG
ncbi:MAG: hypothetical protein KF775_18965 [Cyclobacteriaceae bacterium]|nr:hypothetical protein [Cytophagales bacterium]MBX2901739.1 hypothetical protein [Cyclobacteriaceae bacterium]